MSRFWWVRHAPVGGQVITGQMDLDCDVSNGAAVAGLAAALPGDAVLVESGLKRCRQTALALQGTGLVLREAVIEPDLAEQHFGTWQGKGWSEVDAPWFWRDPARAVPPGGESFGMVVRRVGCAVTRLRRRHPEQDVIIIAHAGPIRAALAIALGISSAAALSFAVAPLSLTRLTALAGGWQVEGVNREFG